MKTTSLAKCLPVAFLLSCGAAVKAPDVKKTDDKQTQSIPVAGNTCTEDDECITGEVCDTDASKCAPTCAADKDCEANLKCIDKNEKMYCGESTADCAEDLDCEAGKICTEDGECKTPRCAPLGKDVCPTGYGCLQGACVKQQTNTACKNAAECNTVASCKTDKCDCVASKCQPKTATPVCTAANASTVCKAGEFCDNGTCKPATSKVCATDTDCPAQHWCQPAQVPGASTTCVPGCKDDNDCGGAGSGIRCIKGPTSHTCSANPTGLQCTTDQDCSPGCTNYSTSDYVCHANTCKERCVQIVAPCSNSTDFCWPVTGPGGSAPPASWCGSLAATGYGYSYCDPLSFP